MNAESLRNQSKLILDNRNRGQYFKEDSKCYKCGEKGHIQRNCKSNRYSKPLKKDLDQEADQGQFLSPIQEVAVEVEATREVIERRTRERDLNQADQDLQIQDQGLTQKTTGKVRRRKLRTE